MERLAVARALSIALGIAAAATALVPAGTFMPVPAALALAQVPRHRPPAQVPRASRAAEFVKHPQRQIDAAINEKQEPSIAHAIRDRLPYFSAAKPAAICSQR